MIIFPQAFSTAPARSQPFKMQELRKGSRPHGRLGTCARRRLVATLHRQVVVERCAKKAAAGQEGKLHHHTCKAPGAAM